MHAFDRGRPFVRHRLVRFELDVEGRGFYLTAEDRHGLDYVLWEDDTERGRFSMRSFEAQRDGEWQADLELPEEWSVPHAAFIAWLAREGRSRMES